MDCCPTTWQALTALAIIISGLLGAFIAIKSIWSARDIAKKKAAIDFINASQSNVLLKTSFRKVFELHQSSEKEIEDYAYKKKDDSEHFEIQEHIQYLLNFLENMSVAIMQGIYDEQTIKESRYSGTMRVWRMTRRFIYKLREQLENDTVYMEFEDLAERWKDNPLKPKREWSQRRAGWLRFFRGE